MYLAPEILMRNSAADAATDVYSFGVVLHELFCGQRPFGTLYACLTPCNLRSV